MKEFYSFEDFIIFWLENPNGSFTFKKYHTNKNMLYISNIALLPLARITENVVYLDFSIIHKKAIKLIIPIFKKLNIEFYLVRNFTKFHLNKDEFSIRYEDLDNMLDNYINKEFYDLFKMIEFDIQMHIFNYINTFNCHSSWEQINNERIKKIKNNSYRNIDKEIVSEILSLDRNFKIFSLLM